LQGLRYGIVKIRDGKAINPAKYTGYQVLLIPTLSATSTSLVAAIRAAANAAEPVFVGSVPILEIDRKRAQRMAEDRRLWNEESDDPWGHREDRHRGDEATQAATWSHGCLGEAVIGRALRAEGNRGVKLAPPLEWVPSQDPDIVFSGTATTPALALDIKSASYHRNGRSSWTVNKGAHERAPVSGYLAANLTGDNAEAWYYPKAFVTEHADLLSRESKSGKPSHFYRAFFPQR
jgi:hypothetical protein